MKIKEGFDLNGIATTVAFIIAMVVWGIRLEGKVVSNTVAMENSEDTRDKIHKLRWEALEVQLDELRQQVFRLQNQQGRDE